MPLPVQFDAVSRAVLPAKPLYLAIGMFDGVHLGHRAVIEPVIRAAREQQGVVAVLTFWPHPSALFRPNDATRLMQSPATKARVLGSLGVDVVITEQFTSDFAAIEADAFLSWLKQRLPTLVAVYVGENFRFGQKRRGDVALLAASGRELGIQVFVAPRVAVRGEAVSSTRIRSHLEAGEIAAANALLGYPYFALGEVVAGKQLGRTIGFPTLNIAWSPALRPRLGVYAVRVSTEDGNEALPAVANYGLRPTVENTTEPKLEVHVLADCPFGTGNRLVVELLEFIRSEMKFANVDELRTQIAKDRAAAAEFFQASGRRRGLS